VWKLCARASAQNFHGSLSGRHAATCPRSQRAASPIDPELILLDESFSQLDHATSRQLRSDFTLTCESSNRKTSILVTHRIEDALDMADRIIVLGVPAVIKIGIAD